MKNLLLTLLATSSVDSLNPIGITQQFILQGMVKKPRHIWYFIITTGIVNIIFGYLVYYGFITALDNGLGQFAETHRLIIRIAELALGAVLLFFGIRSLVRRIRAKRRNLYAENTAAEEEKIKSKIWAVTPIALIGIGVVSTASELTSALPYFAFLATLINYKLSFLSLNLILVLYNIIYIAPFAILYFIYIASKRVFDKIYDFFKRHLKKISEFIAPVLILAVALVVIFDACLNIF